MRKWLGWNIHLISISSSRCHRSAMLAGTLRWEMFHEKARSKLLIEESSWWKSFRKHCYLYKTACPRAQKKIYIHIKIKAWNEYFVVEHQMASIASSLSGSGGGRRSAAGSIVAGSLPYHQQQHHSSQTIHHGGSLRNSASTVDVDKSAISSGKASSSHGGTSSTSRSKQIRNEIELLRKIIKDKDALIQT